MDTIIKRWYDMIKIDSIDGHEKYIADYISGELDKMGLKAEYSYFAGDEQKMRPSIKVVLDSGMPGKSIILIGHIDTVPVGEGWNTDPFTPTESGDRVYGRGAMDMKGGLAAILETLEYFSQHKDKFTGKITGCFVADEEVLSHGTYQLISEGLNADYAIMAECRYDNVAIGFRGRYSFDVTVHGTAAHTSKYPQVGENAVISAGRLAASIEALPTAVHPNLKHGTWCVRYIEGGNKNTLTVPDNCYLFVERFVVPGEDEDSCIRQIKDAAVSVGLAGKVDVSLRPRSLPYMHSFSLNEDDPLVTVLREKFKEVTGETLPVAYDPSVCDSNILAYEQGIPTVTFGPSGGGMHAANEYGHPWQVKNCAEIYKRTVADLLNR